MKEIIVLGLGNFLLKDEGVGVHFAERIAADENLPNYVDVEDGATGGINLLYLMEGFKKAIVIDAMEFGGKPGEARKISLQEIKEKKSHLTISLHGINFFDVIKLSNAVEMTLPEIVIIGIQPADMSHGTELTTEVERSFDKVKELVFEEFKLL